MVLLDLLLVVIGFFLLLKSSDAAVDVLVKLSRKFGVSEFVISFLVVGIVSIFPELSIGVNSALSNESSFGLGVVLGSNVADLTLIVGLIALTAGNIRLHKQTRDNLKWFLFPLGLPVILFLDGVLSQLDGVVLVGGFIVYAFIIATNKPPMPVSRVKVKRNGVVKDLLVLSASLIVLLIAGNIITQAAHDLSIAFSIPLIFIGIILALGTCLPEFTLALKASRHKHGELGLGNVYGNVLADCMLTLGVIALISPVKFEFPQIAVTSAVASIVAVLITLQFLKHESKREIITRREGVILIAAYFVFIAFQVLLEQGLIG
ncbi:sodium:calcium antiporter [Candidatus Micrarchaeota archaeon]|nr:sodium:calcium antiporter [Candidatus Micrarchaeota archaeon]